MFKVFATVALLFGTLDVHAGLFRIGYPGTPVTGVDYAYNNIAAAMTAASAGDTIQLYQQYWPGSSSATVTKSLKFIGFGYLLNFNSGLQSVNGNDNNTVNLTFNAGSAGSEVVGVNCGQVQIGASNISVLRCKFVSGVYLNNTINNIRIGQCFFVYGASIYENSVPVVTNLNIHNCAIGYAQLPTSTGIFSNNVTGYYSGGALGSFIVKNNVFTSCPSGGSSVYQNNLFASNCTGISGTGNQFNVGMTNVFVNWNGGATVDTQFVLKPASPALNAGLRNDNTVTDAGIFGGELGEAYRLSGIPPIPAIYQLSAPSQAATANPYTITISVRSNN